jgi:hypothetical protein
MWQGVAVPGTLKSPVQKIEFWCLQLSIPIGNAHPCSVCVPLVSITLQQTLSMRIFW